VVLGTSYYIGQQLMAPVPRIIGEPPDFLGGQTVEFQSKLGSAIVGWLSHSERAKGCVLLLHAIRSDRRGMADRASFLLDAGYHTLCIDFQAHGESPGEHITMGYLEAMDAAAGVEFLRSRFSGLPVAVLGTSLGGASALMADYIEPPEALIVESVFSDVEAGIGNRLEIRLGRVGRLLTPLLIWQIRPTLGIDAATLSPVHAAAEVRQPVLVIYGSKDRHARPSEAKAIYAALQGRKEIWEIAGAAHVDLCRFAGAEYEKRVIQFIDAQLGSKNGL
jgi:pimeloyl-ACP methyl ester carboxylesterase